MSLHALETKLFEIAGSMRNFADVADRCTVTEVVNGPPSIRTWAEMLDEIRGELAALAGGGEAVAWLVLYGDRVVGYVTHESKPYATLAEGETLVPVFTHPAGAVQEVPAVVRALQRFKETTEDVNETDLPKPVLEGLIAFGYLRKERGGQRGNIYFLTDEGEAAINHGGSRE